MSSRIVWALVALVSMVAVVIAMPAVGARSVTTSQSGKVASNPGNVAAGKGVYIKFCGKCHTLAAAGAKGTLGANLDNVKVSFTCVVSAIENGVGGIQAEYVLRNVTFTQIYDVAKYVVSASQRRGSTCQQIG